jgi:GT2 family glycosyltransferase
VANVATAVTTAADPTLDIVIVTYRNENVLSRCVDSVRELPEVATITVVDNGDGACSELGSALGLETIHLPSNPGFGAGQNAGVRVGTSPYLLLLNPDAQMEPGAVAHGLALLDTRPSAAAVQGAVRHSGSDGLERSHGRMLGPVHLLGRALGLRRLLSTQVGRAIGRRLPATRDHVDRRAYGPCIVPYLAATALLVRRTAYEEVGGFDERFFLYGEDLDLCRRWTLAGWHLLATDVSWARHDNAGSASSTWDRELAWWEGTMLYAADAFAPVAWMAAMLASAIAGARLLASRPRAAVPVTAAFIRRPLGRRRLARSAPVLTT